jgi:enamine deaminase RidA (YjgF/YER057c/UK114 family)
LILAAALFVGYVKAQAKQYLTNIKAIIESIDHVVDDLVKVNIQVQRGKSHK